MLHFPYTGDTRPIRDVLRRFAASGEPVFHDYALHGNPSHTGADDLARCYPPALRARLTLYHYEFVSAAMQLRDKGYRVAETGVR